MLYHVTDRKLLERILVEGLVPQVGRRADSNNEKEPSVWLFPTMDEVEDAVWLYEEYLDTDELVILEVDPATLTLEKSTVGWEVICKHVIPPHAIVRVYDELFDEIKP